MTTSLAIRAIAGAALAVLAIGPVAAQPLPPGGQQFQQQPQFQQPQFQQQAPQFQQQSPQQFQQQQQQPQQNDAALQQFQQTLQQYGQFLQHPRYGYVWQPAQGVVPPGWKPYPPCAWSYDRQQQVWVYNDQTPWGQIIHHYGRWALDPQMGWVWVADSTYGPGWVVWRSDAQTVSWAPLPPEQDQADPQVMQNPQLWHTAQAQGFNGQCGPAQQQPVASSPPPGPRGGFVPAPVFVPRPAPAFAPPPVVVTRPPPPVIIDRPPPVIVVGGDPFCRRFPSHPRCRGIGPGPGGFCQRFPNHPRCRGVGPGPNAFCQRFPNHPRCRGIGPGPNAFCQRFPNHPRCRVIGPRPIPNVRPLPQRPGPVVRPFPGRPQVRPVVRPQVRPVFRPAVRPVVRPAVRPAVRPVIRQAPGRVVRGRPQAQQR